MQDRHVNDLYFADLFTVCVNRGNKRYGYEVFAKGMAIIHIVRDGQNANDRILVCNQTNPPDTRKR